MPGGICPKCKIAMEIHEHGPLPCYYCKNCKVHYNWNGDKE